MSMTDTAIAELMAAEEAEHVIVFGVDELDRDDTQPRQIFNEESLRELATTIEKDGQLQPILVVEDGDRYKIAVGERRWRACHYTSSRTVKGIIISKRTAEKILVAQILENIQREAMHPLDEARSFQRLIELGACKNAAEVAKRVGKSEATISQAFKLLRAPDEYQELVATGVAKIDAALDLQAIAKHDQAAADALVAEAKDKGLLERKKTREVKQEVEAKATGAKAKAPAKTSAGTPPSAPAAARSDAFDRDEMMLQVELTQSADHEPLVALRNFWSEVTPAQLRCLAATFLAIADDCDARVAKKKQGSEPMTYDVLADRS